MELEDLISDVILDDHLQNSTNFETFSRLVEIKKKRLLVRKTKKIRIPLEKICDNSTNIDQRCEILRNALLITDNYNYKTLVQNLIKRIDFTDITTNENAVMDTMKMLNVFLEFSKTENREIQEYFNKFDDIINQILKHFSKQSTNFIVTQFLPNYLQLETVDDYLILSQLTQSLKETNRIDILFYLIDNCILSRNNYKLFQMLEDTLDIWEILQESLVTHDYHQQKQTKYLLRKIVDLFFDKQIPQIKLDEFDDDLVRKSWRNFFIVLDITNEKQLHLIQPSLNLLETLKYLHYTWQICLYRILFRHKQISIVYFTATLILQQGNLLIFQKICIDLLNAVNLNEYSQISLKFFREFSGFCKRLPSREITAILNESLKISWNPTTIWCFYSSILNSETIMDVDLVESLLEKVKHLPDVFIRNRLIELILNCFIGNFHPDSSDVLLKFFTVIDKFGGDLFDECLTKFEENLTCFEADIKKTLPDNNPVVIRILEKLNPIYLMENLENSDRKVNLFYDNHQNNLETYIDNRLNSCKDSESIDNLLNLVRKYKNVGLFNKALDILENGSNIGVNRELIAFEILNINCSDSCDRCDGILRKYQTKIWKNPKLLAPYLNLLLKNCRNSTIFRDNLDVFYKILELQVDDVFVIFVEHLKDFQKFSNDSQIQNFIDDLFKRILKIDDNHQFRTIIKILIDDLVNVELINVKILDFIKTLLGLSNFSTIIAILMGKLSKISYEKPELFRKDFSIFIDMIFYGNVINKTEKVEYCVYQDASQKLNREKLNPNLDYLLIRLYAIDSLLNLVKFDLKIADDIVESLLEIYENKSRKRYFPNSQVHLEKLRIVQFLLLLQPFITDNSSNKLINFVIDSFLNESHQFSVKYLMQLLLTKLLATKRNSIEIISENLQKANYTRPTSVSAFIPVLYQLTLLEQDDSKWDRIVEILLNYSMGPQFKLRLLSQIAILKLYNSAKIRNCREFVEKYQHLYQSIKNVVESTSDNGVGEFFENFNDTATTVLYHIPKISQVIPIEWENLVIIAKNYKFYNIIFNNDFLNDEFIQFTVDTYEINTDDLPPIDNIQKKIIPWRDNLIDNNLSDFILVTTLIEKRSNLGGLSRTCEIFRIKQFVLNTINILNDCEFKNLSMSSENWIKFMEIKLNDLQQFLIDIKAKRYCCIGAEQTCDSRQLQQFQFPKLTVLVLGNEKEGIPPNLIPYLDYCVEIPQFGVVRSLNVHVAGAIFMWEYCKQHLL